MKRSWPIVRIVLALTAIFSLGVVVGRLTSPSEVAPAGEVVTQSRDLTQVGRRVMMRYQQQLELTDAQLETLEDKFAVVSRRMEILPSHSRARLAVLEDFHEEMAPHLTEAQRKIADQILESARSRERPN